MRGPIDVINSYHGTLTPNVITCIRINNMGNFSLEVTNRDLEGEIWIAFDGFNPTICGMGSYVVMGARRFPVRRGVRDVRLLSDFNRNFSVEAIA